MIKNGNSSANNTKVNDSKITVNSRDVRDICGYIDSYWPKLIRINRKDEGTRIGLPYPYMVPSDAEVFQEQYYWDSYPIVRTLIDHPKFSEVAIGMVDNLLYLVKRFGIIPNASRLYFLSRSQPPLLSSMVWIVFQKTQDKKWFECAIRLVEKEYKNVWMGKTHLANFRLVWKGLSRYYDVNALDLLAEAESGWDMTARFMGRCLDFLPIDLNCLLYLYEKDLEKAWKVLGDDKKSKKYGLLAQVRSQTIADLMWNEREGYFFDYDFMRQKRSPYITVAGMYPLNVGISSLPQAEKVTKVVKDVLQKKHGVVQSVRFTENKQWDYPNGWAPMQIRVVEGLMRYGQNKLALRLVRKWLSLNTSIFHETGRLWEKYDVVHGRIGVPDRYPTPHGFAWTNACFLTMANILEYLEGTGNEKATPVWLVRHLGWH